MHLQAVAQTQQHSQRSAQVSVEYPFSRFVSSYRVTEATSTQPQRLSGITRSSYEHPFNRSLARPRVA